MSQSPSDRRDLTFRNAVADGVRPMLPLFRWTLFLGGWLMLFASAITDEPWQLLAGLAYLTAYAVLQAFDGRGVTRHDPQISTAVTATHIDRVNGPVRRKSGVENRESPATVEEQITKALIEHDSEDPQMAAQEAATVMRVVGDLERKARQALWDCYSHAGADTSVWDGPDHPPFETLCDEAVEAVIELRTDYYAEPNTPTLPGDRRKP